MPVVMMSGYATIETTVEAYAHRRRLPREKPIALQRLLATVKRARCARPRRRRRCSSALPPSGAACRRSPKKRLAQLAQSAAPLLLARASVAARELFAHLLALAAAPSRRCGAAVRAAFRSAGAAPAACCSCPTFNAPACNEQRALGVPRRLRGRRRRRSARPLAVMRASAAERCSTLAGRRAWASSRCACCRCCAISPRTSLDLASLMLAQL